MTDQTRLAFSARVYGYLGWADHLADTDKWVWKFNLWHFHDPSGKHDRYVHRRDVRFTYPVKPYRRRAA